MGDPRPGVAVPDLVVEDGAEVGFQNVEVELLQGLGGDRASFLDRAVSLQLEIGEHGLAEEAGGDVVDGVLEEGDAACGLLLHLEQAVEKEGLVGHRCHLGDEDRVRGGGEGLIFVRKHAVHRVAHLVGHREGVVESVCVVEEHVGVDPVDPGRECTGAFALVFVDVDPALGERLLDRLLIAAAKDRDRIHDQLADGVVREHPLDLGQGQVGVEVAVTLEPERKAAQAVVALERCGAGASCVEEAFHHVSRDVVAVQARLEGGAVVSRAGREPVLLEDAVVYRGVGVGVLVVDAEMGLEELLAVRLVAQRMEPLGVVCVAGHDLLAVG